VRTKGTNTK